MKTTLRRVSFNHLQSTPREPAVTWPAENSPIPLSPLGFLLFICILSYKLFVYAYLYLSLPALYIFFKFKLVSFISNLCIYRVSFLSIPVLSPPSLKPPIFESYIIRLIPYYCHSPSCNCLSFLHDLSSLLFLSDTIFILIM